MRERQCRQTQPTSCARALVVRPAREAVGHHVGLALDVLDVEVEVGEDVLPSGLTPADSCGCVLKYCSDLWSVRRP